jgi:Xaa-Pro aminopeptidase
MRVLTESAIGRLPFTFSLAERDRRWRLVREMMARRGFDALIVPCNTGHNEAFQADVRYLSQVGGFANEAAVFFPASGEPTIWVRADSQPAEWWIDMQDWVRDVRGCRCNWSDGFAESIREHGLESASFGVVGIGGTPRSPDGLILYGTLTRLQDWFPNARFESATEAMVEVRFSKSDEEITVLERAARIAEQSVLAGASVARPGVSDHEVCAEMFSTMLRNQAELPTLILYGAGQSVNRLSRIPPVRPIARGDAIITEVEARFAGYIAQQRRPVFVGTISPEWQRLHDVSVEAFGRMFALIRPGVTYGEVIRAYTDLVAERGCKALAVPLHGRGLGEDLPLIHLQHPQPGVLETPILAGQVYILGPRVGSADGTRFLAWGDTIAVTDQGARRLGTLGNDPIIAGG